MNPSPYIQILKSPETRIDEDNQPSAALALDGADLPRLQSVADALGLALICPADRAASHQGDGYWTSDLATLKALRAQNSDWQLVGVATDRHEAMVLGEAGADLILFGHLSPLVLAGDLEMGRWWSDLFEVPCAVILNDLPDATSGFGAAGMPEFYAI